MIFKLKAFVMAHDGQPRRSCKQLQAEDLREVRAECS